jgi:hypothetical protein
MHVGNFPHTAPPGERQCASEMRDDGSITITEQCHARVGLLGNPSDGFGGAVIALLLANFHATVTLKYTFAAGGCLMHAQPSGGALPCCRGIAEGYTSTSRRPCCHYSTISSAAPLASDACSTCCTPARPEKSATYAARATRAQGEQQMSLTGLKDVIRQ